MHAGRGSTGTKSKGSPGDTDGSTRTKANGSRGAERAAGRHADQNQWITQSNTEWRPESRQKEEKGAGRWEKKIKPLCCTELEPRCFRMNHACRCVSA